MKKLLVILMMCWLGLGYSQTSCACVYENSSGELECFSGNCGNQNFQNCISQINYTWYQGSWSIPSGMTLCEYLIEITLPIHLSSFTVKIKNGHNMIQWSTKSEINNDFFTIEHSIDGTNWRDIAYILGSGNSTSLQNYLYYHTNPPLQINYYRLSQTDYNGSTETFTPISVDNRGKIYVEKIINVLGQEVNENYQGIIIKIYNDGSIEKIWK